MRWLKWHWKALATQSEVQRDIKRGVEPTTSFLFIFFAISTAQKGRSHFTVYTPNNIKRNLPFLFLLTYIWRLQTRCKLLDNRLFHLKSTLTPMI